MNPAEQRRIRLKNDYQTMVNIKRPWLDWKTVRGIAPHVEEYELAVKVRTIVGPAPDYANDHIMSVVLPPTYPLSPPQIRYLGKNRPFHPNWYRDGRWCFGEWLIYESLGQHVKRMLQTLQYDGQITNPASAANVDARDWYVARLRSNPGLFPCDRTDLPDPSTSRLKIKENADKKFILKDG